MLQDLTKRRSSKSQAATSIRRADDAHDQEVVRRVPRSAGAEHGVAAPVVVPHVVLVAVEEGEHVVAGDGARERVLLALLPEVAVGPLERVVEEEDEGALAAGAREPLA